MKFSIPFALLYLATGVYSYVAAPLGTRSEDLPPTLVERDLATATSVLADISNGFSTLAAAAAAFNGDPAPLTAAANSLLTTVSTGTTRVINMTPLSFFDCLSLVTPVQNLQTQGQALVTQLTAKQSVIQQYKQCATVYAFLDQGATESAALVTAVVNKVPSTFKSTVQTEGNKVTQQLQTTRDLFGPSNCSDA